MASGLQRPDREQEGQDHTEVRRSQDAGEGCGLRGDLRHLAPAGIHSQWR